MSDDGMPRPRAGSAWYKAHGLGNDYLVFEEGNDWRMAPGAVARVCDRWKGVGSDGVILVLGDDLGGVRRLRMFNPDGSEFERSGNGLRIVASYFARAGAVDTHPFTVEVGGNHVTLTVHHSDPPRHDVSAAMGRASLGAPAVGLAPSALDAEGHIALPDGRSADVTPVSVGNPHLVVFGLPLDDETLATVGPFLATHSALAAGCNVQLAEVAAPGALRILIWERGVGRTSASGTSSCAAAVAAVRRGLLRPGPVEVRMPGGTLHVHVSGDLDVVLRGPVEEVAVGRLTGGFLARLSTL